MSTSVERRPSFYYSNHTRIHRITIIIIIMETRPWALCQIIRLINYSPETKIETGHRGVRRVSREGVARWLIVELMGSGVARSEFQNFLEVNIFESHFSGPCLTEPIINCRIISENSACFTAQKY